MFLSENVGADQTDGRLCSAGRHLSFFYAPFSVFSERTKQKMEKHWIIFDSITYAYQARDYLARKGIRGTVERTPDRLKNRGCSYSLSVGKQFDRAVELLQAKGLAFDTRQ